MSNRTIQTYNRIARTYRTANQIRAIFKPQIKQFARHLPAQGLVLDVGCGPAMDMPALLKAGLRVVGADLSWGMLAAGRSRCAADMVQADMRQLPFAAGFDGIWANASLLHLTRPEAIAAIGQFAQLLRPNGILYLAIKKGSGSGWAKKSYGHHEPRFFTYWHSAEMAQLLQNNQFKILDQKAYQGSRDPWLIFFAQKL